MKLITYVYENKERIGVLTPDERSVCEIEGFSSVNELIIKVKEYDMKEIYEQSVCGKDAVSVDNIRIKSPIPCPMQDVICLGINYTEHAKESEKFDKEAFGGERPRAIYFSKRVNESPADGDDICGHFDIVESLDYEAELGVVIGKDAKDVPLEDVINDISARNIQTAHKQWYFGKSLDGFTPMGPCILTADEVEYPPVLKITAKVNGELRQNSTTDLLITDIDHIVHELSKGITLKAGTIIATGTPSGVGMGMNPPCFLKDGDIVECKIEKIGSITNKIVK